MGHPAPSSAALVLVFGQMPQRLYGQLRLESRTADKSGQPNQLFLGRTTNSSPANLSRDLVDSIK